MWTVCKRFCSRCMQHVDNNNKEKNKKNQL